MSSKGTPGAAAPGGTPRLTHLPRPDIGSKRAGLAKAADRVRSTCKRCRLVLLHGQPSVWLSGPATGLAHADCDHPDGPEVRDGR